jgi:hypothetical protein
MHTFSRLSLLGGLLALFVFRSAPAQAGECLGDDNQHQCWKSLSGPNYCQVAVGNSRGSVGIACAVTITTMNDWGGTMHCFAPVGSSGAVIRGRAGQEVQDPGQPFIASDPARRIVSLAIVPLVNTPLTLIYALRSDGQLLLGGTVWPITENGDPRIFFGPEGSTPLPGIREIAYAPGLGLVATTTTNQKFVRNGSGWNQLPGSAFLLGGNNDTTGDSFFVSPSLGGGPGTSIGSFAVAFPPQVDPLPRPLASGPDRMFGPFGRTRPLTAGPKEIYALVPNACAAGSPLTPCILRATPNLISKSWRWSTFPTGDIAGVGLYPMPWTIQDGIKMRGVQGEVWVITGFQHLKFWAP